MKTSSHGRFPITLRFDDASLVPGTFGRSIVTETSAGRQVELRLAARFAGLPAAWPALVAYHIPTINYGQMPTAADVLAYGAQLLGLSEDEYHRQLCEWTDES